jgi:hypothetical protein
MKNKLFQARIQLMSEIERIDTAIKFLDEHPEMENLLNAVMALQRMPQMYG